MSEGEWVLTERRREATAVAGELWLDWDARQKRRQLAALADGRVVRLMLERLDEPLAEGDVLAGEAGAVRVRARPERLLEARGEPLALARGAYHLGNRHARVMLGAGWLMTPEDPVMAGMLRGLGLALALVEAPFSPEVGAYHQHGAGHAHDEAQRHGHGPARIHRFVLK